MLGWSINLFRIRGIQLALHWSFLLLLAYTAYQGYQEGGVTDMAWSSGVLLGFFTCVVLHELGHSFTAIHFGVGVRRILLMPIGGMAEFDNIPRQPSRELLITLAGPAVNFAIAAILWIVVGMPAGWPLGQYDFPPNAAGFAQLLAHWNLIMGCFNLAPVFPMDGGRILRALLATRMPYLRATYWAATVGKVLAIVGAAIAIYAGAYLVAVLFTFIFTAGEGEYRAVKRREEASAHWQAMLARINAPNTPPEEPPLL